MREELQKGGDSDRCRAGSSLRDRQVPACRARACRRGTPLNAGSASRRVSGPRSAARQERLWQFERCAGRERRGARARAQGGTWAIWRESESMTVPHTSALISLEVNMLSNMR